jgi:anti-sigma factor RsiW
VNCVRLRQVLDAWIDGELDHATSAEIAVHLDSCSACASLRHERDELRALLRGGAQYHRAPPAFQSSVRRRLAAAADAGDAPRSRPSWLQAAALIVFAAVVSALAGYWVGRPAPDSTLREQVVASHVASLGSARHLTEVVSADRHTVKPWFQGKVDFAPTVRDLSGHGFVLAGGRLDHVADRQAAAIVYRVRNHVINLFVWRAGANDEPFAVSAARGFNLVTWSEAGLGFAAVSDVDVRDIERFARLVQAAP